MTTPTDLGNRIQGFLKRLADHNLSISTNRTGGEAVLEVYAERMGEQRLVATFRTASELENAVSRWENEGWPESDGPERGSESPQTDGSGSPDEVPSWLQRGSRGGPTGQGAIAVGESEGVVFSGKGDYSSLPGGTLVGAIRQVLTDWPQGAQSDFISAESVTQALLKAFPGFRANLRTVGSHLAVLANQGSLLRSAKQGWFRIPVGGFKSNVKGRTKNSSSTRSSSSRKSATTSGATSSSMSFADLLAMGEWKLVGKSATGGLIYKRDSTGDLYRISVSVQQL